MLGLSTAWDECEPLRGKTTYRLSLLVPSVPVASGSFNLSAFLLDESGLHVHDQVVVTNAVRVNPPRWTPSLLSVAHSWARG